MRKRVRVTWDRERGGDREEGGMGNMGQAERRGQGRKGVRGEDGWGRRAGNHKSTVDHNKWFPIQV